MLNNSSKLTNNESPYLSLASYASSCHLDQIAQMIHYHSSPHDAPAPLPHFRPTIPNNNN